MIKSLQAELDSIQQMPPNDEALMRERELSARLLEE